MWVLQHSTFAAAAQLVQAQGKVEIEFQTFRTPLDQLQWVELPVEAAETRLATPFSSHGTSRRERRECQWGATRAA